MTSQLNLDVYRKPKGVLVQIFKLSPEPTLGFSKNKNFAYTIRTVFVEVAWTIVHVYFTVKTNNVSYNRSKDVHQEQKSNVFIGSNFAKMRLYTPSQNK